VGNVLALTRFIDDEQAKRRALFKETALAHRFLAERWEKCQWSFVKIPNISNGILPTLQKA
jgi:hypothetical protein